MARAYKFNYISEMKDILQNLNLHYKLIYHNRHYVGHSSSMHVASNLTRALIQLITRALLVIGPQIGQSKGLDDANNAVTKVSPGVDPNDTLFGGGYHLAF